MKVTLSLRERLSDVSSFAIGVELVSIRGSMAEERAVRARTFANQLVDLASVHWVSITDNAGGHPQLAPMGLGKPLLYAGKEVVIHLTCKDQNRNGLESEAWQLNSEGFHNVLAMTGDYPVSGNAGTAKPVFDLDSVGLISLLTKMNGGFDGRHEKTSFLIGAVVNNYKLKEGELIPQYLKLQKKVACGASFIINQVGFDARKADELLAYMRNHGMAATPLIGNVFVLSAKSAAMFNAGKIPGVVVSDALRDVCEKQGGSADGGLSFFCEMAARQIAIFRGLGYRGAYLGGVHNAEVVQKILELEKSFSSGDWREFAGTMMFSRPGEFFFYEANPLTGLADPSRESPKASSSSGSLHFALAKVVHDTMFTEGHALQEWGAALTKRARDPMQGPKPLRAAERTSKALLFDCRDCGDCSLPEVAFLCPESQCAKNQRNGPCGGTRGGKCEVEGYGDCIWLRAYERLKSEETQDKLLDHVPVVQDQSLRGTSSWANNWLKRDHAGKPGHNESSKSGI